MTFAGAWSLVNPDHEYLTSFITCRQIQGVQEVDEIAISWPGAVPLSKTNTYSCHLENRRLSSPWLMRVIFHAWLSNATYQTHDILRFLLSTYIWVCPVADKRWQLRSPPAANCLRTALASTTTPLEQVQRKRSKKTEEMLVQGRHPSSKMTTSKTLSSKTASPVRLSIPMHRWVLLSWPFALSLHIIIDWYVFSSEKLNDLMKEPLPQLFQEVPSTLPTRRWR